MIVTHLVRLKRPSTRKHKQWLFDQQEYAACVNWCMEQLQLKKKLSSKAVPHQLKSAIKNEAIRRAKKAIADKREGRAKTNPTFKPTLPISINNQNWDVMHKNGHWYIGFTSNLGKRYLPVYENEFVHIYFPYFVKEQDRSFRGTIQLLRKGKEWYLAIPVELACDTDVKAPTKQTPIGIDLGLRHLAVVSEPASDKRQFFSGKEVGYKRRHFRSLRKHLGKKKAQRAIKRIGQKEMRWMTDTNRKLAKDIVDFALQFENPVLKLEQLDDIRSTCTTVKQADRTIHSWAFYQLKQFIKQRACKFNIPVFDIEPAYTSQTCHACGHVAKANRNQKKFKCKKCGHKDHADLNAAKNIARSTILTDEQKTS
jgi:putative transposase